MNQTAFAKLWKATLGVVLLGSIAGIAGATPLVFGPTNTGLFNGGGLSVSVTSTCINFYNSLNPDICPGNGTSGAPNNNPNAFTIGEPSDPKLFTNTDGATIKDLPGVTTSMTNWISVPAGSAGTDGVAVTFDLTGVIVPSGVACPGNTASGPLPASCAIGDFVFTQDDFSNGGGLGNVTVSFATTAIGYTGTNATSTPYRFNFSSQFTDTSVANLINQFIAGTPVNDSVSISASPLAGVPEPSAYLLFGSGLVGLAFFGKRVRARR